MRASPASQTAAGGESKPARPRPRDLIIRRRWVAGKHETQGRCISATLTTAAQVPERPVLLSRAMMLTVRCHVRPLMITVTLMIWLVSGPVGMAFDGCAMMGAMCEAPCGAMLQIVTPAAPDLAGLSPVSYLASPLDERPIVLGLRPPSPPPKSAFLSA